MTDSDFYAAFRDPYCYDDGIVLRNRLGLRSSGELELFEVEMVALRGEEPLPTGAFDCAHYRAVHHHLFQDVYEWAGQYRTVRIAKPRAVFCYPEFIEQQMDNLFPALGTKSFLPGVSADAFVAAAARFLSDLNAIHPFREGNGRTQLTLLFLLGERVGHSLDMARIAPGPMLEAMIESFKGSDGPLAREISGLLHKP